MSAKKIINHVAFVIDESASMINHRRSVVDLVPKLAQEIRSNVAQESQVTFTTFNSTVNVVNSIFDAPRFARTYWPSGMTALRDGVIETIRSLSRTDESDGNDHSYLIYVVTDGEENRSINSLSQFQEVVRTLPDNWTLGILVPNISGVHQAKMAGFPAGNIEIWDVNSEKGFEEVANKVSASYQNYTAARSAGARGSSSLFKVNTAHLTPSDVRGDLKEVSGRLYPVQKEYQIRDFVEQVVGKSYVKGQSFYELKKSEKVQDYKEIVVVSSTTGKKFGGADARNLLGIPSTGEIRLAPGNSGNWRIFIQSTSVNRKLAKGESLFVKD